MGDTTVHGSANIACANLRTQSKLALGDRHGMSVESLRDENDEGRENENPFPTSLNRCNAASANEPAEAILMRHSRERTACIPVRNLGS